MGPMPVASFSSSSSSKASLYHISDKKNANIDDNANIDEQRGDSKGGGGVSSSPGGVSSSVTNGDSREGPVWVVGGFCGHGMPRSFGLARITARRLLGLPLDELDEDTSKRFNVARLFSN
jgi:hypothetical protein